MKGEKIAKRILDDLKKEIKRRQLKLRLAVILVGDDQASKVYVRQKGKAAKGIGVDFKFYHFPGKISQVRLEKEITEIVNDKKNSGILIQLPLPGSKDTQKILNLVPESKDVDLLSEASSKKFSRGKTRLLPPTTGAISMLLKEYGIRVKGKQIVIVGAGRLVGRPLAAWFKLKGIKFSLLDKNTKDIFSFTKKADILITGVGKPRLIDGESVKKGVVVIDAGTTKEFGKTAGDIDFKSVSKKAGYITPVIGGVGPLTVACLLDNLVNLSTKK